MPASARRYGGKMAITEWEHPGGKLIEEGAENLTDAELLSILIAPGTRGRPALTIAEEVLRRYGSLQGLANRPLEEFLAIKGLGEVKIIRLAAAYELALRLAGKRGGPQR